MTTYKAEACFMQPKSNRDWTLYIKYWKLVNWTLDTYDCVYIQFVCPQAPLLLGVNALGMGMGVGGGSAACVNNSCCLFLEFASNYSWLGMCYYEQEIEI